MKDVSRRLVHLCRVYAIKLSERDGLQLFLLYFNSHAVGCAKRLKAAAPSKIVPRHPLPPNRQTFKCPYCATPDLTCAALRDHVTASHASASNPVVIEATLSCQCLLSLSYYLYTDLSRMCVHAVGESPAD